MDLFSFFFVCFYSVIIYWYQSGMCPAENVAAVFYDGV